MSAVDYAGFAKTAKDLITRYGTSVALLTKVKAGPAHNPTIGWGDPIECVGVLLGYKNREIDGVRITSKDRKVLMVSDQETPTLEHRLRIAGDDFEIIEVKEIKPATLNIFYEVQVRA